MNAPLPRLATDLAPIEDVFFARCEARALLHVNGCLSLHDAVDELQAYAEQSGLIDVVGQDDVQAIMSRAFVSAEMLPDELSEACEQEIMLRTADLVRRWEAEAPLPPPKPAPTRQRCEPPQSTIDAFWYVVSLGKPQYLRTWLHDRPRDKAYLLKILESKRCCKFQPKR